MSLVYFQVEGLEHVAVKPSSASFVKNDVYSSMPKPVLVLSYGELVFVLDLLYKGTPDFCFQFRNAHFKS